MSANVNLVIKEIPDEHLRDNFQKIQNFLNAFPLAKGEFKFVTFSTEAAVSNFQIPHYLGYTPRDILVTSVIGSGSVTWHYDAFDATNLVVSTTGPVTVRLFAGNYG